MSNLMLCNRRATPFLRQHKLGHDLKIKQRETGNSKVVSVAYKFFTAFGNAENLGTKLFYTQCFFPCKTLPKCNGQPTGRVLGQVLANNGKNHLLLMTHLQK